MVNSGVDKLTSSHNDMEQVRGQWSAKILIWFDFILKLVSTVWPFALVVEQTRTLWPHLSQNFTGGWTLYYLFGFAFTEGVVFVLGMALIIKQWLHQPDRVAVMLQLGLYAVQVKHTHTQFEQHPNDGWKLLIGGIIYI
jgi:hypothetical protein